MSAAAAGPALRLDGGQRQVQRQSQRLALTPRMRQSLAMLQMPAQELDALLAREALENPAIDLDALECGCSDWDGPQAWDAPAGDGTDRFARAVRPVTLRDELRWQLMGVTAPPAVRQVAEYLVDSLDGRGYLPADMVPGAIADARLRAVFDEGLALLQSLEPAGVGAHSLEECLLLQLGRVDAAPEACRRVVLECLPEAAAGSVRIIAGRLGVPVAEVRRCLEVLASLDPIPSRGRASADGDGYVRPEAVVRTGVDGRLEVERVTRWTERLRVADGFRVALPGEAGDYVRECVDRARRLMDDVRLRDDTVSAVVAAVVERQPEALYEGRAALVPMTIEGLAADLGLSPSTVSRAVHGKWLLCPCGMMSLRAFFTKSGYAQRVPGGSQAVSGEAVKARLRELVAGEDCTRPLSDRRLSERLAEEGVEVSRRTVAKYRDALGLPGAARRRVH